MTKENDMMKYYVGVDVGGTSIKMGIVDGSGNIGTRREVPYREMSDDQPVIRIIINSIRDMISSSDITMDDIAGIGVSAAGCINSKTGSVARNGGNIPGWSYTEVCRELKDEFNVPAALANDANCAILGELWIGAAKGYSDVLGVTLGTGVGGGVITGGKLLEGSRGYAGEIGHFPTHAGGEHCICGLDGCFERYASTSALSRKAAEFESSWNNGRALFGAAESGDEDAKRIIDEWIGEIAWGVAGLIHIFDPQLILIGGGVSAQEKMLIRPLRQYVLSLVMPDYADGLEFKAATLGNDAGMVGAVYYLLSRENPAPQL